MARGNRDHLRRREPATVTVSGFHAESERVHAARALGLRLLLACFIPSTNRAQLLEARPRDIEVLELEELVPDEPVALEPRQMHEHGLERAALGERPEEPHDAQQGAPSSRTSSATWHSRGREFDPPLQSYHSAWFSTRSTQRRLNGG